MQTDSFSLEHLNITSFLPEDNTDVVIYCNVLQSDLEAVFACLQVPKPILVGISGMDWNGDLSPWQAKQVFRAGGDFSGGANAYLQHLTQTVIPEVERRLAIVPNHRGIAGYSLAGLFALYSLWQTDCFDRMASVSGSLWFDGLLEYFDKHPCRAVPERCYFSLGEQEKNTRNPRMATVETATRTLAEQMKQQGIPTKLELHTGGHFQDTILRLAKGIDFLA